MKGQFESFYNRGDIILFADNKKYKVTSVEFSESVVYELTSLEGIGHSFRITSGQLEEYQCPVIQAA